MDFRGTATLARRSRLRETSVVADIVRSRGDFTRGAAASEAFCTTADVFGAECLRDSEFGEELRWPIESSAPLPVSSVDFSILYSFTSSSSSSSILVRKQSRGRMIMAMTIIMDMNGIF